MNKLIYTYIRRMLVVAVCAMCALSAHAQSNSSEPNGIQAINLSNAQNGQLMLTILMKHALSSMPQSFTINTPPRIAFDFPETKNNTGQSVKTYHQNGLSSINIVQAGNRTRLVVNLEQAMSYQSKIEGNNLLISLNGTSTTSAPSRFAEATTSNVMHRLLGLDFHRGKNGEGRIEVNLSDNNIGIDIHQQGTKVLVDFKDTNASRSLQHKLDVTDFGTPVDSIDTFAQGDNVRMVVEPTGLWEQSAYQADNKFVLEIKPKVQETTEKVGGKKVYKGDKLTLNFQNIAVREALNVIADFTGLNIVISDSVTGSITLRLKDVPWDQALDIIMQSKGLDMRRNGNVIQVAPRAEIAAAEKVKMTAAKDISDLEPLRTESFILSYQKGSNIVALITNKDQRILSKRGSAVVDTHTNTLFVQDTPSNLEQVRKLIQQVDVPVRQVMIEARFVSATDKFSQTIGGNLGFTGNVNSGWIPPGYTSGTGGSNNVSLPGASSGFGGINMLFSAGATKALGLELSASELDGTSKNIASPRVVTADNVSATISAGTQIPYQQATSSGATAVAFKDATLALQVTPQITPDDKIDMKLSVNQDTVGTIYAGVPSVDTKRVNTEVLVDNGGTVVIGGVYTKDVSNANTKVPLVGDIPIIGWLFKNNATTNNKSELLIFITPKILKDSLTLE